jgi:hypothetical protein
MIHLAFRAVPVVVVALMLLTAFSGPLAPAVAQAPVDPQSLIGEWSGEWRWKSNQKFSGPYTLTIEKVEGTDVFGEAQMRGRNNIEFKFRGKLEGNHLTFGREAQTDLVIDGKTMTGGRSGGQNPVDIKLTKTK